MLFFNPNRQTFHMFNLAHFLVIFIVAIIIFLIIKYGKIIAQNAHSDRIFRYFLGTIMVLFEFTFYFWHESLGSFSIDLLPLGLCAMSMYLTSITLFTNSEKLFKIIFPWAITGSIISLIVADHNYSFPHFRFFHYFVNHASFLIAHTYLVFQKKFTMNYRDLLKSMGILSCIAFILYFINHKFNTNYMFLSDLPVEVHGMFYWLGHPLWVFVFAFCMIILFHLWYFLYFYLPKKIKQKQAPKLEASI